VAGRVGMVGGGWLGWLGWLGSFEGLGYNYGQWVISGDHPFTILFSQCQNRRTQPINLTIIGWVAGWLGSGWVLAGFWLGSRLG